MTEAQKNFLLELSAIQEQAVAMNRDSDLSDEKKLYNVSYDTLYLLMELLDGYRGKSVELSDKDSQEIINHKLQLHDEMAIFLKSY